MKKKLCRKTYKQFEFANVRNTGNLRKDGFLLLYGRDFEDWKFHLKAFWAVDPIGDDVL